MITIMPIAPVKSTASATRDSGRGLTVSRRSTRMRSGPILHVMFFLLTMVCVYMMLSFSFSPSLSSLLSYSFEASSKAVVDNDHPPNRELQLIEHHDTSTDTRLLQTGVSSYNTINLCPHVLSLYGYDNVNQNNENEEETTSATAISQQLQESVDEAIKFHKYGGSLKSVQKFLDGQIDQTLSRLGVDYEPTDRDNATVASDPKKTPVEYLKEYYQNHNIPRGGYGQELPVRYIDKRPPANTGSEENDIVKNALMGKRWIDVTEQWHHNRYVVSVGPDLKVTCPNIVTFSPGTYEEKKFCVTASDTNHHDDDRDGDHNNTSVEDSRRAVEANSDNKDAECHIFSIGSNDQWGFEEDVMKIFKNRRCHTHTFDCTLPGEPKLKPQNDHVHFYPYCVGSQDDTKSNNNDKITTKKYLPYSELWNATGISSAPKLLKMDVEGFEFDVLISMLSHAPSSTWPEQIMMEVHWATRMVDVEWMLRTRQSAEIAMFFDILFNVGGYMPVTRKYFRKCSTCMEILLMRVNCA